MKRTPFTLTQAGITITDLMVGCALGMVLTLAIARVYLSSVSVQQTQDDVTRLDESARYTFDLFARELRKAGYRNTWTSNTSEISEFCADEGAVPLAAFAGLNDPSGITPSSADMAGGAVAIANSSDAIRVRYYGDQAIGPDTVADCQGYAVAPGTLVQDTLYVAPDPNNGNEPALWCHTDNPVPATATHPGSLPLVAGVESLQILYGEDTDSDGIINRYVPWQMVSRVHKVSALKLSAVVRGSGSIALGGGTATFRHFGPTYPAASNDDSGAVFTPQVKGRLRMLFATEIAVRNFGYCSGDN
jgi:type IV pilus assembly protein PilW